MNVLLLHQGLRKGGLGFVRCRYLLADLESHGHTVHLASYLCRERPAEIERGLEQDIMSVDELEQFAPDVLLIELGAYSCGDRVIGRDFLNELKLKGCIVVHCGLDLNEYSRKQEKYDALFGTAGFEIAKQANPEHELPNIRGPHGSQTIRTQVADLREYCAIRDPQIFEGVPWVESHHALVLRAWQKPLITAGPESYVKAYSDDIHGASHALYGMFNDSDGIEILITGHFVTDRESPEEKTYNRRFLLNVLEYLHEQHPARFKLRIVSERRPTRVIVSYAWVDNTPVLNDVGLIDAVVQALRDRQILVDRDVEIFRAGHMPLAEWSRRLPEVDKAIFFHSKAWRDRPTPNNELLAAEREADRRFIEAKKIGKELDPFILFFRLDDTAIPERHHSHLYRSLTGLTFEEAVDRMYRDIVGVEGRARSYDVAGFAGRRL